MVENEGRGGKSDFFCYLMDVFDDDFVQPVSESVITESAKDTANAHTSHLIPMSEARLCFGDELSDKAKLDARKFKKAADKGKTAIRN